MDVLLLRGQGVPVRRGEVDGAEAAGVVLVELERADDRVRVRPGPKPSRSASEGGSMPEPWNWGFLARMAARISSVRSMCSGSDMM